MKASLLAGLAVLLVAGIASGSTTVTLTGVVDNNNWYVYAKVVGDNDGLSFLDLSIAGINEQATTVNALIQDDYVSGSFAGTYGFNGVRGSLSNYAAHTTELVLAMDPQLEGTSNAKYNIRQIGKQAVSFTYGAPDGTQLAATTDFNPDLGMLVASGARLLDGTVPSFTEDPGANVWTTGTEYPESATSGIVENNDPTLPGARQFLPEPATIALMGAGALVALIRRRR